MDLHYNPKPTMTEEQIAADLAKLMDEPWGRRIAWWLLDTAGIYHLSYRDTPQAMAFAEGKRAFGLLFLDRITAHAAENYLLMQQEALHERHERRHRLAASADSD